MAPRLTRTLAPAFLMAIAAFARCSLAQPLGPNSPLPASAAAAISDIPDDADLIIVIEHASELRTSPIGDAVSRFLADSKVIDALTKAWAGLADQLGLSRDDAFNRLLGQRVILISKGAVQGNDRLWAILSDISVDTDEKLKDKLQAAPRAIDQGHQILTIENGQYQLTSHLRAGTQANAAKVRKPARPAPTDRVTLILGPSAKPELFDEMLTIVSRAASGGGVGGATKPNAQVAVNNPVVASISAHDVFDQVRQAGPTEVLILAALDPAPLAPGAAALPADRWRNFVMLAGHRELNAADHPDDPQGGAAAAAWRSRIVVRQTERRADLLKIESTSEASFRALSEGRAGSGGGGALIAMIQNAPLPDVLGAWAPSFINILSIIPIPEDAKKQMSAPQALCVRALPPNDRISCTLARGTASTEQLARTFDPEISAGIQRIERQFGIEAPSPQDYAGLAPNAIRTTSLANIAKSDGSVGGGGGGLSMFSSRPLTISWAYPSQVAVNGPVNLADRAVNILGCAMAPGEPPNRPGWWVLNISQNVSRDEPLAVAPPAPPAPPAPKSEVASPAELLRSDANALLTVDPNAHSARWVWLAAARPAALEAVLPSSFPDFNGIRSALRRFESIDLKLQITDLGDIQGDLALKLTPAAK